VAAIGQVLVCFVENLECVNSLKTEANRPPLDLTIAVATPENISFEYQLAGPFRRLPAFLLDVAFRCVIVMAVAMFVALSGLNGFFSGSGALFLAGMTIGIFLLNWFYGLLFEGCWNGQTPGKRVMGLRVVSVDGRPINGAQATIRNFVRVADIFPYASTQVFGIEYDQYIIPTFVVALVCMVLTRRFQRLGDIAAGTMVVVDEKAWYPKKISLDDARIASLAEYIPASFRMSRSLAQTIALYVERRPMMSERKRETTAAILAQPLRQMFGFRDDTLSDLLLCALYYREFFLDSSAINDAKESMNGSPLAEHGSPFQVDAFTNVPSAVLEVSS